MKKAIQLLPLKVAARALGIKSENLKQEADAGSLPYTKVGDDYLFSLAALEKVLSVRAAKRGAKHAS